MSALADDLVPHELWALVDPLLPAPPCPPYGGRRRKIPDRNCLAAMFQAVVDDIPPIRTPSGQMARSTRRSPC